MNVHFHRAKLDQETASMLEIVDSMPGRLIDAIHDDIHDLMNPHNRESCVHTLTIGALAHIGLLTVMLQMQARHETPNPKV